MIMQMWLSSFLLRKVRPVTLADEAPTDKTRQRIAHVIIFGSYNGSPWLVW